MQKILERSSEYDAGRPAMPWALAITGWECRTLLRKRARRKEESETARTESSEDAENDFVQRDLIGAAMNALGTLSDTDRDALVATFWEEAASVSGATLRQRRARALARLRETFRRLYGLE
jgi:RNA polymerase sigma-70 factor (ECF subfamily)